MLKKLIVLKAALVVTLAAMAAQAVVPVEIVGLFKDMAVIRAGAGEKLLKVGDTTSQGVTLISANSREAVVAWQGRQHKLGLSKQMAGQYEEAQISEISIPADDLGQYRIRGAINDHYVDFLVDTGASVVALSSAQADALGINYKQGQLGSVQTAQGNAESFFMNLQKITVAGITAHNVQAAIITGQYPVDILLGMSFLKQVSMRESGGVMTLVQNY
jgi:aspartyl protease family protein